MQSLADAFLFGQINNGNAVSYPLGLNWGWAGEINFTEIIRALFDAPFGAGYPVFEARRKKRDTERLKQINYLCKKRLADVLPLLDLDFIRAALHYGIEQDADIHTLAIANMIMRRDGKSHVIHGDCFDKETLARLQNFRDTNGEPVVLNKGLLNPPYSQKDHAELEFVEQELGLLCQGGELAVVCPVSCAIGTKFRDIRKRLMQKHTLKAVFSMPDDIFYGNNASTNVCVMVWEAGWPHDSSVSTFFGFCKDDGFVKKKKLGRIDAFHRWHEIKARWLG